MRQNKIFYHAFRMDYHVRVLELRTPIHIGPALATGGSPLKYKQFTAIWDTGATGSVITNKVVEALQLIPISKTKVYGVNSEKICNVFYVDIGLPNRLAVKNVNIIECEINSQNVDVIIGMDIIQMGDFAICNPEGKTIFSYCFPSHKNPIDLYAKSKAVNPKPKR